MSGSQALVRELFDAFNRGDVSAQIALLHEDYRWRPAFTGGGLVEGRSYRGHEGFREYLSQQSETWAEIQLAIEETRDLEDDSVLVLARIHARGHHGVTVEQPFGGIWTIRDGKFSSARVYPSREAAKTAAESRQGAGDC